MKKTFTTITFLFALFLSGFAQNDTLLFEDFQNDSIDYILTGFPPATDDFDTWANYDLDGLADQSGSDRPDEWFLATAWAEQDTNYMPLTYADSDNVVLASNSWTLDAQNPVLNYCVLPKIWIADNQAVLRWKSAPFQTPRYLDGYQVLVSTAGNEDLDFTDTLAVFAEFDDATDLEDTTTYTFSDGIRHTLVEIDTTDVTRQRGVLQEWEVSLEDYVGQTIHICFLHQTYDDNLVGIDDILVLGTGNVGINEQASEKLSMVISPNPSSDRIQINYHLNKTASVTSYVYDIDGRLIDSKHRGMQLAGDQQFSYIVSNLAAGSYFFTLDTGKEKITEKFVVTK